MAYTPNTWIDGTTPVDASRLNSLEGGVQSLSNDLDELNSKTDFTMKQWSNAELITAQVGAMKSNTFAVGYIYSYRYQEETGAPVDANGFVIAFSYSSSVKKCFFIRAGQYPTIYSKSCSSGTWSDEWITND